MSYWVDFLGAEVAMVQGRYKTRIITAGEGPPLLLLHGTGGHAENYVKNVIPLSKKHRVIAMDFLWHGLSDTHSFSPEIIPALVDQVIDVLDTLKLDAVDVEGQSMGGWVAMALALRHPDRVRRLVLTTTMGYKPDAGSIAGYEDPDRTPLRPFFLSVLEDPSPENLRKRMQRIVANPDRIPEEAIETRRAFYMDPAVNAAQREFVWHYNGGEAPQQHVITDALARRITQPTLVYWGEKNSSPQSVGQRLASQIPGARYFCAPDTGHWAQFENFEIHNREVLGFLAEDKRA